MREVSGRREGPRVAVTGGCGFIGSALVRRLAADPHIERIVVIDDERLGSRANLGDVVDRVEFHRFGLGHEPATDLAAWLRGCSTVYHLAAAKLHQSAGDPAGLVEGNVRGMFDLLQAAVEAEGPRVVYASSLYAYGRYALPPAKETDLPAPDTLYGVSKLAGEHMLAAFRRSHGLTSSILRLFFVYGPFQYSGVGYPSVIVRNFTRMLGGEAPVVFGDGLQALDYVFVDDVVDALRASAELQEETVTFNVASGTPTTVLDLTRTMLDVSGSRTDMVFGPPDWTAGTCRAGSNALMKSLLGFVPETPLTRGLELTFAWMGEQEAGHVR